jgi:polyvinyl alcohol dehydrogenase (cytochrome)
MRTGGTRRHLFFVGVVIGIVVATVSVASAAGAEPHKPGSFADARGANWPMYGHDFANTRLNPHEHRVTRETVAHLTESWSMHGLVGVSGTPTVVGSRAYFGDWTGTVRAVETRTGRELWSNAIGGGFIVGAPAVHGNAVYVSNAGTLYRLDRNTGAVRWKAVVNDHPFAQINASPVVVGNLVIQGVASAEVAIPRPEYTFRGSIGAYDTRTGREVWRLYTTSNDATSGAGIGVWSTPAIDTRRGMLYVGTGNNYSEPTGPLADSILAIEYETGRIVWSRQFTNPDVFSAGNPTGKDADVGASPNLWWSNGRALVGAGDKAGVYHALDRDTGEVVWERTLTPGSVFGGEIGSGAFVDGKLVVVSNVGDPNNAPTNVAKAFAIDPATGRVLWEAAPFEGQIYAPVAAVPGVAFVGTTTGLLAALDTGTGARLWTYQAPDKTGCGPSIVNGRVLWGYGFFLFGPSGDGGVLSFTVDGKR